MTQLVEKRLRRMGLDFVCLHGGIPTAKRGALMDSFRNDDAVQVFISTDAGGVGLNLQSGSALINLDVPWNPAVLEQRNARVHRLGQKKRVQIITMVAADSYEQHVLGLVGAKQDLFDNVVKEDATEDVVGVSKKLLETLIDDLAGEELKPALDLLVSALLAKAGDLAGFDKPLAVSEAGGWTYGEALPQGLLGENEANMILWGISLNQANQVVPELFAQLMEDAALFIEQD